MPGVMIWKDEIPSANTWSKRKQIKYAHNFKKIKLTHTDMQNSE